MKNKIIFIAGDLAAGKSTYAKHISEKLNIPYFLKDTCKEILSDAIGYNNREENLKLSHASFKMMVEISKRLMEKGCSFILESNFRQSEIDEYEKLIEEYAYDSLFLVLKGDIKILHNRYLKRIENNRHRTHLAINLSDYNDFHEYIILKRDIKPFGKCKMIEATDFSYFNDDKLFK